MCLRWGRVKPSLKQALFEFLHNLGRQPPAVLKNADIGTVFSVWPPANSVTCILVLDRLEARIIKVGSVLQRTNHLHRSILPLAALELAGHVLGATEQFDDDDVQLLVGRAPSLQLATMLPTSASTFCASLP
jgi:hypothetical protein